MLPIQVKVSFIENLDKVHAKVIQRPDGKDPNDKDKDKYEGFVHVYFVKPNDLLVIKVWDFDTTVRFYKNEEQFGLSVNKAAVEELRKLAAVHKPNVGGMNVVKEPEAAGIVQQVMKIAFIDIKKRIVNKQIKYPFYVDDDMQEDAFETLFLEAFPLLKDKKEAAPFLKGYVKIGSFMTWKSKVRTALEPLSKSIHEEVLKQVAAYQKRGTPGEWGGTNRHGENVLFKTHKLLSNALLLEENKHGFNNESPFKLPPTEKTELASYTQVGSAQHAAGGQFKVKDATSWAAGGVSAPKGVPALSGVLAGAFNRVLLRHGFQWKDPGAGIAHGEYTHRYQWNAVFNSGITDLGGKSYLEIFRSMGNLWARHAIDAYADGSALNPGEGGRGYYIWQMIFDATWRHLVTGLGAGTALNQEDQWKPRSDNYTCPEVMNKALGADGKWPDEKDPLYALMVMNHVRWKKRGWVENKSRVATPHNPITRFGDPASMGSAMPKGGTHKASVVMLDKSSEQNNYIIWYVTEDDGTRKLFT